MSDFRVNSISTNKRNKNGVINYFTGGVYYKADIVKECGKWKASNVDVDGNYIAPDDYKRISFALHGYTYDTAPQEVKFAKTDIDYVKPSIDLEKLSRDNKVNALIKKLALIIIELEELKA